MANIDKYVHIKRFVDRVRGTDFSGNKPLVMPAEDAKGLNADITKLLIDLQNTQSQQVGAQSTDNIVLSGGDFKSA